MGKGASVAAAKVRDHLGREPCAPTCSGPARYVPGGAAGCNFRRFQKVVLEAKKCLPAAGACGRSGLILGLGTAEDTALGTGTQSQN